MAITVKHSKVSTIPDEADTSLVRPSDWNADHTLVGLGTMAEQNANNVNITGGSISGVSGFGTVTSITAGTGLTGGTITTSGTIAIDSTVATLTGTQTLTNKTLTTPIIGQVNDVNSNEILLLTPVTSATDYFTLKNGIGVGVPLHIVAEGSSTNIGLHIQPKGSGLVTISDGTDFNKGIRFRSSSSAASAITLLDAVSTFGRVVTLPDATTTLVGRDTTDTLTNKSISGSTNTLTNIANASLTNSAITINGTSTSLGGSISVGTVTSVTGTSPVVSSGGATPAISMPAATTSVNGYLTSTDWTTFNNKGNGTVTSVSGTGTVNGITLTGTVTSTGNLTLGGTLSNVSLTSQVTGILPVANGGFVAWQSVQTSSFTAVSNNAYPVNSTSGAITVTFPASPTVGSYITIIDYAGTAGVNNITLNPNGNKIQGSTASAAITGTRQAYNFVYIDSTQGWISYAQQYSNFQYSASYLIVAGGGGGGSDQAFATAGAGAGAGGLLSGTQILSSNTVYNFVIGAGGAGGAAGSNAGSVGNNSTAFSLTSLGGGGGGNSPTVPNGGSGGSGGGSGGVTGGSGTSGQGNAGGRAQGSNFGANMGGGGGAGAVGGDGNGSTTGGNGGIGSSSSITGSAVYYAGGGGGAGDATPGTGGSGGGGSGGTAGSQAGANGTANTGGGGGGSSGNGAGTNAGGTGGSGVVIISVPTAYYSGIVTGSPTVTTSGSNTIVTFTASGSYTA